MRLLSPLLSPSIRLCVCRKANDRFKRVKPLTKEVMLGRESVIQAPRHEGAEIAAWNIIEISTRSGILPLATNAVLV